jgi:transforming growth factor-beta-induced protein
MNMPPIGELRHLLDRLKSNDIAWFRDSFKSGKFAWLKDHLPGGGYEKFGERIEAGDLGHVKSVLGGLNLPGVDLFKGLGGAVSGGLGAVGAAAAGAAGVAGAASGTLKGGAKAGVSGATALVNNTADRKKKGGLLWLLPLVIGALVLGFVLSRCNKDKKDDAAVVDSTEVVADSVAADSVAADSVVADSVAGDSVVADSVAVDTTLATAEGNIVATALGAGQFTKLGAAINAAGLTDTLEGAGPFTVFAPTDDAFAKLPAGVLDKLLLPENKAALTSVLTYHVVSGKVTAAEVQTGPAKSVEGSDLDLVSDAGKVTVNGAAVLSADVAASNGVIHAIDTVLVPPTVDLNTLVDAGAGAAETTVAPATAEGDIVAVAASNGSFSTLVTAVEAAGLVDTLKGEGPFTVFAPTDDAFKAVPADLLAKLLLPGNKAVLAKVLTYHVIPGKVSAADVQAGPAKTVEGSDVTLAVDGTTVKVNDATVITADVPASNGVIHVIDKVILPADFDPASLGGAVAPDPTATNAAGDATPEDLTVYFASASAALDSEANAKIEKAVATLSALPAGSKVNVIGHADKNGDPGRNQRLSERRAANVVAALNKGLGDKAANIAFTSAAKGDSEQAADLAKSRRVTIEIQK